MLLPFGDTDVTLLHKSESGYARHALTGCSWTDTDAHTLNGNVIQHTLETTCRIPAFGQQKPSPGDVLILGDVVVQAASEIALMKELERVRGAGYSAFRVQRVKDNSQSGVLAHYAASGE